MDTFVQLAHFSLMICNLELLSICFLAVKQLRTNFDRESYDVKQRSTAVL